MTKIIVKSNSNEEKLALLSQTAGNNDKSIIGQYALWKKTFDDYINHPIRLLFYKKGIDKDLYKIIDLLYRFGGMNLVRSYYNEFFSNISYESDKQRAKKFLESLANGLIHVAHPSGEHKEKLDKIPDAKKLLLFITPLKRHINHLSQKIGGEMCIRKDIEKINGVKKTNYVISYNTEDNIKEKERRQEKQKRHDYKNKHSALFGGFSWMFAIGSMTVNIVAILVLFSNPAVAIPLALGLGIATLITNKALVHRPTKSLMVNFFYDKEFTCKIADDVESPAGKAFLKYAVTPFFMLLAYANGITIGIITFMSFLSIPTQLTGLGYLPVTAVPIAMAVLATVGAFVAITTIQCIAMLMLSTLVSLMKNTIALYKKIYDIGLKQFFQNKWNVFKELPAQKKITSVLSKVLLLAIVPATILLAVFTSIAAFGTFSTTAIQFWTGIMHTSNAAATVIVGVTMSLFLAVENIFTLKNIGSFLDSVAKNVLVKPMAFIISKGLTVGNSIVHFFSQAFSRKKELPSEITAESHSKKISAPVKKSAQQMKQDQQAKQAFKIKQAGLYIAYGFLYAAVAANALASGLFSAGGSSKIQRTFNWVGMQLGITAATGIAAISAAFKSGSACKTGVDELRQEDIHSSSYKIGALFKTKRTSVLSKKSNKKETDKSRSKQASSTHNGRLSIFINQSDSDSDSENELANHSVNAQELKV